MVVVGTAHFLQLLRNPLCARTALLGIDWGSKHVGVAIAASLHGAPTPLTTLPATGAKRPRGRTCRSSLPCAVLRSTTRMDSRHPPLIPTAPTCQHSVIAAAAAGTATLHALIRRHNAFGLVVGWPVLPDGSTSPQCVAVNEFVARLQAAQVGATRVNYLSLGYLLPLIDDCTRD